jgi:hypothetical protein
VAQEVDGTINKHPPEVRVLPLKEQIDTRLDAHLGTAPGQFRELIVGQAIEKADSAKLVGAHHTVAVLFMRSAFGRASLPASRRGWRDGTDISHTSYPGAAHDLGRALAGFQLLQDSAHEGIGNLAAANALPVQPPRQPRLFSAPLGRALVASAW